MKKDFEIFTIFLLYSVLAGFLFSIFYSWDFHAYHYYNGWAFLNHRLDIDIMPAIFRSYFNPLIDSFSYLLIKTFNNNPALLIAISNLKYGIFLFLSYKIFDLVINKDYKFKQAIVLFMVGITISTPLFLILKNIDFNDLEIAVIILLALYLFLKTFYGDNIKKNYILIFFSSFLIGAAFGLKYTNISFCIALPLVVLLRYKSFKHPIKTTLLIIISMFSGFLLTDGFWLYTLWHKFHNPMFPYFNEIFHSPYADYDHVFNTDFHHIRPKNIFQFIFHPILGKKFEMKIFDLKSYFVFLGGIIVLIFSNKYENFDKKIKSLIKTDVFYFILFLIIFAYYINAFIFGNVRYICPVYAISSIPVAVFCWYIFKILKKKYKFKPDFYSILILFFMSCLSSSLIFFMIKLYDHSVEKFIEIENLNFEDNSIVFCGTTLSAFLVPEQNPKAQYIFFSVPKEIRKVHVSKFEGRHWNDFYTSKYLVQTIKSKFQENRKMYIIFSDVMLGYDYFDLPIYKHAINYYSGGKKELKDCRKTQIKVGDRFDGWPGPYLVCKIE